MRLSAGHPTVCTLPILSVLTIKIRIPHTTHVRQIASIVVVGEGQAEIPESFLPSSQVLVNCV
jgi:hypothetical protein